LVLVVGVQKCLELIERLVGRELPRVQIRDDDHVDIRFFFTQGTGGCRSAIAALQEIGDTDRREVLVFPDPLP
jgi:hypothetical protein